MINLKKELKNGKVSIGSWLTIGDTAVTEIMSKAGFDWLAVDMEHSAITLSQAQELIRVIELSDVVPLVRVGENNPNLIKRVMDLGAHGVIVPMVNSREDALKAVNAVKYPPLGTRGVGLARAQGYGLKFERYKEWVKRGSIVIVQIEHIDAVNNLEDILSVEGVDGFMIGPYDLSGSIGHPGDFKHPDMSAAIKKIMRLAKRLDVPAGFHAVFPDAEIIRKKINEGFIFLALSLDALILANSCKELLAQVRKKKMENKQ